MRVMRQVLFAVVWIGSSVVLFRWLFPGDDNIHGRALVVGVACGFGGFLSRRIR